MDTENYKEVPDATLLQRRPSKPLQNVDDLFTRLGNPGRFQVLMFCLLALSLVAVASNTLVGVFFDYRPTHLCNTSVDSIDTEGSHETSTTAYTSITHYNEKPQPSPNASIWSSNISIDVEVISQKRCSASFRIDGWKNISKSCQSGQWIYSVKGRESSVVTEFDLVCDNAYLASLVSSLYFVGLMLGGFFWGYLSDTVGRRLVVMITAYCSLAVSLGIAFSQHIVMLMLFRLLMGFFVQGLQTSAYILAMELFPVRYRGHAGSGFQLFWGAGVLYLSAAAWLAQNWRYIQVCLLGPIIVTAVSICFIPESLRWLLAKGKTQKAGVVVSKITSFNNLPNPVKDEERVLSEYKVHYVKKRASYFTLIGTREMRKRIFCTCVIWFAANFGYFGLSYNIQVMAGNRYLNFLIAGVAETISYAIVAYFIVRFGRRRPLMMLLTVGSLSCIIAGVIPRHNGGKLSGTKGIVATIFSILGRFCFAGLYAGVDIFSAELLPTVVRNMGMGVCVFSGRLGAGLAPQTLLLGEFLFSAFPPLLIAGVGLTAAFLTFLLSETKGKHLPDTVLDVETSFGRPINEDGSEKGQTTMKRNGVKYSSGGKDVNAHLNGKTVTFNEDKNDGCYEKENM